jgi:hypothetical protein
MLQRLGHGLNHYLYSGKLVQVSKAVCFARQIQCLMPFPFGHNCGAVDGNRTRK